MKVSGLLILACVFRLSRGAYQVGKTSKVYKHAVEKATKTKIAEPVGGAAAGVLNIAPAKGFVLPQDLAGWKFQGPPRYWYHHQIHSLGNTGIFGALHSVLSPLATFIIDASAYSGDNLRQRVAKELRRHVNKPGARVADLCCGVGMSTQALQSAFQDADVVVGIDTSPEMISMARLLSAESILGKIALWQQKVAAEFKKFSSKENSFTSKYPLYYVGNAESTLFPSRSFDLVTIMYAFHEAPLLGRYRMLREVRRLLNEGGTLAVIDISPEYTPRPAMLAGEPYVLEYQNNIQKQLSSIQGFADVTYKEIVPDHVSLWTLTRKTATPEKVKHNGSFAFLSRA